MALEHIRNLVFEGGGVRGIAYVGALKVLQEQGIMNNVKRFCGTSAGAITAWLACYYKDDLAEIESIQRRTNFKEFADDDWGVIMDVHRLLKKYGWHKGDKFYQWVQGITRQRFGKDNITFHQLFEKTGRELLVTGCNVSKGRTMRFSKEHTPELFVERALRISMSIPLYFSAIFIHDENVDSFGNIIGNPEIDKDIDKDRDVFVDGGVLDNYPIQFFDDPPYVNNPLEGEIIVDIQGRTPPHYNKSTLGFRLDTPAELEIGRSKRDEDQYKMEKFLDYVEVITHILLSSPNKRNLDPYDWHRTIRINTLDIKTTQFDLTRKDQDNLMAKGCEATGDYLNEYNNTWLNYV